MKTKLFFTTLILFGINFLHAQQWTTMAPMPTARASAGVAVVNNLIYVIGGSDATFASKIVEVYDPSVNTWITKTPMSVPRTELVLATVNGKIYAIGGYNGSTAVNTVEEYDPATNKWTTKASMPTARSVISGAAVNNKIYVVGGWPGNKAILEEYNPETNTWATKTSCSQGRHQINGCVGLNGKLYFMGGKNDLNTIYYQTNEAYDPITNTWSSYSNLPISRFAGSAVESLGEIHYFGGGIYQNNTLSQVYNTHYIFNTTSNLWTTGTQMLSSRFRQVSAVVDNKIYIIGGVDGTGKLINTNERYDKGIATNCPTLNGTLANGVVAYYPFCGNANDTSGNNFNGTVSGATLTTDRFGNTNAAYSFNGTNNYITLPSTVNQQIINSYTISLWFNSQTNATNFDGYEIIGDRDVNSYVYRYRMVYGISQATEYPYNSITLASCNATACKFVSTTAPVLNVWDNYVISYDGNTKVFKGYKNGILIGTENNTPFVAGNRQINLGRVVAPNYPNGFSFVNGKIDDVAIYNRSLNDSEISNLYNANVCYESITVTDTLIINTGILSYNPVTYNNTITIYPNPANDHITIDCGTLTNVVGYSIKITNSLGQEVFNKPMNTQQYNVPLNSWSGQGMYFVNIIDDQGHIIDVRKIILQ